MAAYDPTMENEMLCAFSPRARQPQFQVLRDHVPARTKAAFQSRHAAWLQVLRNGTLGARANSPSPPLSPRRRRSAILQG